MNYYEDDDYDYYEYDDYFPTCPKCDSANIEWKGGDTVVNTGSAATFTHVDWYTCNDCGHKFSASEDYS